MGDMADYQLDHACWGQYRPPRIRVHDPHCPGKPVFRRNKKLNTDFIGCSAFPACKWSRSIPRDGSPKDNRGVARWCYIDDGGTCQQCMGKEGTTCYWCGGKRKFRNKKNRCKTCKQYVKHKHRSKKSTKDPAGGYDHDDFGGHGMEGP